MCVLQSFEIFPLWDTPRNYSAERCAIEFFPLVFLTCDKALEPIKIGKWNVNEKESSARLNRLIGHWCRYDALEKYTSDRNLQDHLKLI